MGRKKEEPEEVSEIREIMQFLYRKDRTNWGYGSMGKKIRAIVTRLPFDGSSTRHLAFGTTRTPKLTAPEAVALLQFLRQVKKDFEQTIDLDRGSISAVSPQLHFLNAAKDINIMIKLDEEDVELIAGDPDLQAHIILAVQDTIDLYKKIKGGPQPPEIV